MPDALLFRRGTMLALLPIAAIALASPLRAQGTGRVTSRADSLLYQRAQRLVATGDGAEGRRLVDSALAALPTSSPRYAEGLYWRAALAVNGVDAERDYRRVAVEYPLSERVHDALIRLAQLELARGDRALARAHLQRLLREHPPASARASAWYWMARLDLEENSPARACASLDSARAHLPAADNEVADRVARARSRCGAREAGATDGSDSALTIQVAALPTRTAADRLRSRLAAQGHDARVVGTSAPFRVRVGRYATRADAERAAAALQRSRIDAWIVTAEPRR